MSNLVSPLTNGVWISTCIKRPILGDIIGESQEFGKVIIGKSLSVKSITTRFETLYIEKTN